MHYYKIDPCDTANGPGLRVTLWVSGCTLKCEGCFNPETHDFSYGQEWTPDSYELLAEYLSKDGITGLSVLGGEPSDNAEDLLPILRQVRKDFPEKTIWMWSGRVMSALLRKRHVVDMLKFVDVLVDGPFIQRLAEPSLKYRGSMNQRVIHLTNFKNEQY